MFILSQEPISIESAVELSQHPQTLHIDPASTYDSQQCYEYVLQVAQNSDMLIYGINTGFGALANTAISKEELKQLQINLLRSHACGMGDTVPIPIVRLMLLFKIKALLKGYSGVNPATIQQLAFLWNANLIPVVYTQGSLGASGDLAPLAHLSLPLIKEGQVWLQGKITATQEVESIQPIELGPKEGLALINGTQFITAYGAYCIDKATQLWHWANAIAALSLEVFDGRIEPFDERLQAIRPHVGQSKAAEAIRKWVQGSQSIRRTKNHVQDPYSLRCIPQVHGATYTALQHALEVFTTEINAVSDNPNIFYHDKVVLSGGNFHAQVLALPLDYLAMAMCELANISERRTYLLLSGQRGLPLFLGPNPGLNSGLMIPQYVAAGIVSEVKMLCMPNSVDSIPTSNGQEDHVSMGANSAVKLYKILDNIEKVLAIELLCAAQGFSLKKEMNISPSLKYLHQCYREVVPFIDKDRFLHQDLLASVRFLQENKASKFLIEE
ncbi:MAG: histidine ammonia-lyase [Bacteroidia bacterium]|nr:histidine ammonia-lyase [Bacteroidia bacterium]MDW8345516.1 histidine ammonia-lyase [Bacteroidia bacterium]